MIQTDVLFQFVMQTVFMGCAQVQTSVHVKLVGKISFLFIFVKLVKLKKESNFMFLDVSFILVV